MAYQLLDFFTDPLLRAPTIGSMLMCAASSLIGVIVFIRRKSLVGEALSHAAYPGLVLSAGLVSFFIPILDERYFALFLVGAFCSSLLGLYFFTVLQKRFKVKGDSALCFMLSSFFGIGVLFAGRMQVTSPLYYRQIQTFLYGQVATMTDMHIGLYGGLFLLVIFFIALFYRSIQLVYFDKQFAQVLGVSTRIFEAFFCVLLAIAVVVAMKSVGIVLLSGMLIAPALAARQFSHKLSTIFVLASLLGAFSGFFGNYFSVQLSGWFLDSRLFLPTGPMIVLVSSAISIFSLLVSPKRYLRRKV